MSQTANMIEVVVTGLDTNEISALVKELREMGYRVGTDYNFEFSTGGYDWQELTRVPPHTVFTWFNETGGTWFALKWA